MRLAIFGSRTLSDERVEELIQLKIDELKPECIITSGETSGVNEIARAKAKENKIRLVLEFANNKKYAAGKYEHRSIEILKQCEFAIFIHDGQSKGTLNELAIAKKMRKRYEYIKLDYHDEADLNWDELKFEWSVDKS
jgi:hypothetical protein